LRRKNLLPLNGRPLTLVAADHLDLYCDQVVISTDDLETESVAASHGYEVHRRDPVSDEQTIAQATQQIVTDLEWEGDVLVLQPTVPYPDDLTGLVKETAPTQAVVPDTRHRASGLKDWITTGIYYWPAGTIGNTPTRQIQLKSWAGIDIDTIDDYQTAQRIANQKSILIEYVESQRVGTGHRWRAHTLAAALQHHDVAVVPLRTQQEVESHVDMVITDNLDNDHRPMAPLWVTFEDHGKAVTQADLIINALYPARGLNERCGPDWAILRPEFLTLPTFDVRPADEVRVLVMFGGTDPARLYNRMPALLHQAGYRLPERATFLRPTDNQPVAATMRRHDILVAGRTVYEAAAVGIPTIVMAQNNREATHRHLGPDHGNIYLGLGRLVTDDTIINTIQQVAADRGLRQELSDTARRSIDGRGLDRVVSEIDRLLAGT
jgi:spore coat polysaccharide biosynthesis predicted glycosyltransferase SpsG